MRHATRITIAILSIATLNLAFPFRATSAQAGPAVAITGEAFLSELFTKIDEQVEKFKIAGDYMAVAALGRLRVVLEAWHEENRVLLETALTGADRVAQDFLRSAGVQVDEVAKQATMNVATLRNIGLFTNSTIENTLLGGGNSYIVDYYPRVISPLNESVVSLTLLGVNLDKAKPVLYIGNTKVPTRIVGPTEVTADLPVALLPGKAGALATHVVRVEMTTSSEYALLRFIGWRTDVERALTLYRVPRTIATFEASAKRTIPRRQETTYRTMVPRLSARNSTAYGLATPPTNWQWATDLERRKEFTVLQTGGEKGTCHKEIGWNGSTPSGVQISARLDEIRTAKTGFGSVNRKGGWADCGISGPVYRTTSVDTTTGTRGTLTFGTGTTINLQPSCTDAVITVRMFNGRTFVHKGADASPYYTITGSNCSFAMNAALPDQP